MPWVLGKFSFTHHEGSWYILVDVWADVWMVLLEVWGVSDADLKLVG